MPHRPVHTEPRRQRSARLLAGRAFVARRLVKPAQAFVQTEASGGIVLLAAAVFAILWANSPWDDAYFDLWNAGITLDFNVVSIDETLGHLVNDGLMAVFFFVVGLEIKRELLHGELATPRKAALPVAAALGGMLVPAAIYASINAGGDGAPGWGIPMATDIAFALGILALAGSRVSFSLKVFLLALAIVDDLGAIVVIALFYTGSLSVEALLWAGVVIGAIVVMRRAGVRSTGVYVVLGALLWVAVLESGIHATLAGVVLAALTPARPYFDRDAVADEGAGLLNEFSRARDTGDPDREQAALSQLESLAAGAESPLDRLERALHPWVSYLIVPIFALANAGLVIDSESLRAAAQSPVTLGVTAGLVLGKPMGIVAAAWLALRTGIAEAPDGIGRRHLLAAGLVAGIGFTVSLFITGLAFDDPGLVSEAKMGILGASIIAGIGGFGLLRAAGAEDGRRVASGEAAASEFAPGER